MTFAPVLNNDSHFYNFSFIFAQRSKDGSKTVTSTEVVNSYTALTADALIGNTTLTVTNSNLNSHFTSSLSAGDLIMLIQIQGTSVEDTISTATVLDDSKFNPTWGKILDYNNCGSQDL